MPERIAYYNPIPKGSRTTVVEDETERKKFYNGKAWKALRLALLRDHPLCERCERRGIARLATIAHHRKERLDRPDLALDFDNLEALCSPCHTEHHKKKPPGGGS